ncbi:septation ring formation regulator EzrA [Chungangia koreensis]|uniref:Septation ring formation regulator EzrA n=2 Tax=Chungangia koreensis TaxID=752657 RepID=A0ABV8X580_9LACT
MMESIIIGIIILIAILTVSWFMRRKHISIIAKLENDKLQIQNRPILEEMTKVKQLNMNGQTEEMFERWRNSWTEIMDIHMPKIDSLLFDAEEMLDRFRFRRASQIELQIGEEINFCDEQMNTILRELHELIGSEEKNRNEIDQLHEQYRSARKTLLAHQHSFGVALDALENKLEEFKPLLEQYDELTGHGDYLKAREIVLLLSEKGDQVFHLIQDIPVMLSDLQQKIPASIADLRGGQREMEEQSYYLEHLQLEQKLGEMDEELNSLKLQIADLDVEPVKVRLNEMKDEIESIYDLLENEVMAKQYVDLHYLLTKDKLEEVTTITRSTNDEALLVQQSYRLSEKEAELPKEALKNLEEFHKRYEIIGERMEEEQLAYSALQSEIQEISDELDRIESGQRNFAERLKSLREDEIVARNNLEVLQKLLQETDRKLHKANIPGIPEEMDARLEEAEEHVYVVMQSLQEIPLNMNLVTNYLEKADKCIHEVKAKADEMLENVMLIERIIQYGNRYRAHNPEMNARLLEAEEAFRQFRYAKALEDAGTAVEEFEPGAMRKIELLVKQEA